MWLCDRSKHLVTCAKCECNKCCDIHTHFIILFDCYVCMLTFLMSKIVYVLLVEDTAVPVKFKQTAYSVYEDEKSVSITLQALKNHTFSFYVSVSTRDGTASCE